jgi:hypothetical protein
VRIVELVPVGIVEQEVVCTREADCRTEEDQDLALDK